MSKKKIIAVFLVIIAIVSFLVFVELSLHPRPFTFNEQLPAGTYQGTLSPVSPPQLYSPETGTNVSLVWGITISNDVYSGLNLPNGTIIYIVSSTNFTSYSNFITDLSSLVSEGLSPPSFNHGPEVISFSGTLFNFKDYDNHELYGLDNAKIMPPVPQPA